MNTLIDWFCCSIKSLKNLDDIFTYLLLEKDKFKSCNPYNFYQYGLRFDSITILYTELDINEQKYYNVFFNLSGQGCRQYETIRGKLFDWIEFIKNIQSAFSGCYDLHVSRIDIAFDIKDNSCPDMLKIIKSVEDRKYISTFRRTITTKGAEEFVFFGSPQSDTRLRIYNKALERGCVDGEKWVRFEYQLRNQSVSRFLNHLYTTNHLGQAMLDFLNSSVRFIVKSTDTLKGHNHDRLNSSGWWNKLIKSAGEITKFNAPGIEYNMARASKYLNEQVAPTLYAYIEGHGGDINPLIDMLANNKYRLKDKHRMVIQDGIRILEDTAQAELKLKLLKKELFGNNEKKLIENDDCFVINI
jgi:DNA relaxase NicK